MVDDSSRTFLGRRSAAAALTAARASYFLVHAVGPGQAGIFSFAGGIGLFAAALGFARRSLTGHVLARAAAWLVFVPTALQTVFRVFNGHAPHAAGALLAFATGAALLLARPMLRAGTGVFAPARFRSSFLAGAITSSSAAIGAAVLAIQGVRSGSALMTGFNAALSLALLASVLGVLRMRAWGVLLGGATSFGLLALMPFYGSANAITLWLAATPALVFWVTPLLVGRASRSSAATRTPETRRVRIATEMDATEAEALTEVEHVSTRAYAPRALPL